MTRIAGSFVGGAISGNFSNVSVIRSALRENTLRRALSPVSLHCASVSFFRDFATLSFGAGVLAMEGIP